MTDSNFWSIAIPVVAWAIVVMIIAVNEREGLIP